MVLPTTLAGAVAGFGKTKAQGFWQQAHQQISAAKWVPALALTAAYSATCITDRSLKDAILTCLRRRSGAPKRKVTTMMPVSVPKVLCRPPGQKQSEWVDLWEAYVSIVPRGRAGRHCSSSSSWTVGGVGFRAVCHQHMAGKLARRQGGRDQQLVQLPLHTPQQSTVTSAAIGCYAAQPMGWRKQACSCCQ